MADPAVTVLTTVRDGERYIGQTIRSIQAQTFTDWEYVIVDDGSTDTSAAIVNEHARQDPRIKLVTRTAAGGPYAAANHGLAHSCGRYIARIDGDDLAMPLRLERQIAYLQAHPQLRACAGFWQTIDSRGEIDPLRRKIPTSSRVIPWFLSVKSGFIHSAAFVEREALRAIGDYTELPVAQDYRLWCDLSRRGWLGVVPEVVTLWRSHPGSIGAKRYEDQVRAHNEILREHLSELTGSAWSADSASALFRASRARDISIEDGFAALDRWESAWRASDVAGADRRALGRLSVGLRLRLVRSRATQERGHLTGAVARSLSVALRSLR